MEPNLIEYKVIDFASLQEWFKKSTAEEQRVMALKIAGECTFENYELIGKIPLYFAGVFYLELCWKTREIIYRAATDEKPKVIFSAHDSSTIIRPSDVVEQNIFSEEEMEAFFKAGEKDTSKDININFEKFSKLKEMLAHIYSVSPQKDGVKIIASTPAHLMWLFLTLSWFRKNAKNMYVNGEKIN